MYLDRVLDPRGPLERVNRDQMREYAERNGIKEITWDMSGDEMRYILRKLGVRDIGVPHQILGTKSNMMVQADNDPRVPTVNLEEQQRQEFERRAQERAAKAAPKKRGRPKKVVHGQPHAT